MRRLRSILYTPGHRTNRIEKAVAAGADATCFVLEDSVPHDLRALARRTVAAALKEHARPDQPLYVKVNALGDDGLAADLLEIARPGLSGIIVPKISRVDEVAEVERLITDAEMRSGLPSGTIDVILMIETPRAVVDALQLIEASPRIASVVCAAAVNGDLAGSLGLESSEDGLERAYVLAKVLVDARAAGIETPFDGVWTGIGDLDGLEREARRARALGYRAKLAVHPEQIATIHQVFTPSADEIARSTRVVEAFEAALARGDAAIVVDGRMIDYAMAATARRVLELATEHEEPVA